MNATILKDGVEALLSGGYYKNREELIRDALISLFRHDHRIIINEGVELYKKGNFSLSSAA